MNRSPQDFEALLLQYINSDGASVALHDSYKDNLGNRQQQMNTPEAHLSPHSCAFCKHSHRKCDRALPQCGYCTAHNKECNYDEKPLKRGPKTEGSSPSPTPSDRFIRYEPYPQHTRAKSNFSPSPSQSPQPFANIMPTTLESYFEHMFLNTPVIDRAKANAIINFGRSARLHTSSEQSKKMTTPNIDDMALIFAMQAWFYRRLQMRSLSDRCFETCKNLLGNSYDRVLTNFSVAVAYIYMGLTLLDENDIPRATFYLENVAAFIQRCKARQKQEKLTIEEQLQVLRERFLEMVYQTCTAYMQANVNLIQGLKRFIYTNFIIKQYRRLNSLREQQGTAPQQPQDNGIMTELDEFIPYLKNIKEDLDNGTDDNFKIDLNVIDRIANKFKDSLSAPSDRIPELVFTMRRLSALFMAQGAKIQYLQRTGKGNDPVVRQVADYITALSDNAAFNLAYPMFSYPIHLAMSVHRQCLEASDDLRERMQLVELLRADIKALYALGHTSKIVLPMYGPLIYDVEHLIKEEEERQRRQQLFSSLKTFMDGSSTTPDPMTITEEVSIPISSVPDTSLMGDDLDLFLSEFLHETQTPMQGPLDRTTTPSNEVLYW
jgi:hypothetical protein